jgi:hypothetical protein
MNFIKFISYVKVEFLGFKYLIIGVYMPFDINKLDSILEYEMNITILSELIKNAKVESEFDIIIGGNFNADLYRSKRLDIKLIEFIEKNKIFSMDTLLIQQINYSYRNGDYRAKSDHILVYQKKEKKSKEY